MSTIHEEPSHELSLADKLKAHYAFRKREPLSPQFCNKISPPWYLVTILGAWLIAQSTAFPVLYENLPYILLIQRLVSTVIFLEIMVNWFFIWYVSSAYDPHEYGIQLKYNLQNNSTNASSKEYRTSQSTAEINSHIATSYSDEEINSQNKIDIGDKSFTVYIATELPDAETLMPKRTPYPYWSWKPCLLCQRSRPPRCHHCPVCRVCVLKRDHHCYFTGSCIGLYNQRHFVVFNFWSSIGTIYAMLHAIPFIYYDVSHTISWIDLFLPLALARYLFGYLTLRSVCIISVTWSTFLFTAYSTTFLYEQVTLLTHSLTSFERDNNIKVYDSRSMAERLRSVFGEMWLLNFLIPMHSRYVPDEDPINWPTIKK